MFLDALCVPRDTPLNDISMFEHFPRFYSYSFVLQHPENHIVLPISHPSLYLIAVYDIMPVSKCLISIPQSMFQESIFLLDAPVIRFPKLYRELVHDFSSIQNNYQSLGVMITHLPSGDRCSIRNPVYNEVLRVRQMDTCLQYQYLCLRRLGKVTDFLIYFPEHKKEFFQFYEQIKDFLENIHASYVSFYVLKTKTIISLKYRPYIRRLHKEIYLPSLTNGQETVITRKVVNDFMNLLEPSELLYALSYERRELLNMGE